LFSSKYLNYEDWRIVYNILLNKEHVDNNKLDIYNKGKSSKDGINNKRIYYKWDPLNNFYKA